jgi:uncharacterized membrane protein YoaK (UPF0700 family)
MLDTTRNIALASALSALAGYIDGVGFLHLGGLFVSFMSGNTTRLGVTIAEHDWFKALEAIGLIALFVAGASIGTMLGRGRGIHRQWVVLLAETLLLGVAAACYHLQLLEVSIAAIVLAMGLENAVFQADGGAPGLGLTYMTGTLVRVGQLMAGALTGGPRWAWVPNLLLWSGMAIGALLGALAYQRFNLASVWFAAAATLLMCVATAIPARRARH